MNGKKNNRYYRSCLLVLILMVMVIFTSCGNDTAVENTEPSENEATQTTVAEDGFEETETIPMDQSLLGKVTVQTKYLALSYSDIYTDVLVHQEVLSDTVTMEIFSLQMNDGSMELFRIYFGDEARGIVAGYLTADGEEIPVTYTICQYNDDEFVDEDTRALYFETMNCFNEIMAGLQADNRFQTEKAAAPVENAETELSYWTVTLPDTMEYEESEENGQYKVAFYGNVAGERIALYTIYIGDPSAETVLGTFDVNGEAKKLSVENYEIMPAERWTDEDQASAYAMMATINDVIQAIMSSENFSEEIPQ